MKRAECHAERPHFAKNLCAACYLRAWKARLSPESREQRRRAAQHYFSDPAVKDRLRASRREARFQARYGISATVYDHMHSLQGGACAICERRSKSPLHLDHDHETGKIRGLLCHLCNLRLVNAHTTPTILRRAAEYLERSA